MILSFARDETFEPAAVALDLIELLAPRHESMDNDDWRGDGRRSSLAGDDGDSGRRLWDANAAAQQTKSPGGADCMPRCKNIQSTVG